ncbi:MAG TPA: SRPBCC family protein [Acidimicrobiales bacterium]|nr:SRPBCC family protein [Acidimicrobiales bacterium]
MEHAEIDIAVTPEHVWAVLADANTFADWVVGCKEVRHVEGTWPEVGAQLHHTLGVSAATIEDTTSVLESDPYRLLVLRARAQPAGIATVRLELAPADDESTTITMEEEFVDGAASHIPNPVADALLKPRNAECLRRLKRLAEERATTA